MTSSCRIQSSLKLFGYVKQESQSVQLRAAISFNIQADVDDEINLQGCHGDNAPVACHTAG